MEQDITAARRTVAVSELNVRRYRDDTSRLVNNLDNGLTVLADLLYLRLHEDVEKMLGLDSMLAPVSPSKTKLLTMAKIDLYQIAESAVVVRKSDYLRDDGQWYVSWLSQLRLGELSPDGNELAQIADYLAQTADQRRLTFTNVLAQVVPESRRAPLVLFQLVPLAVHITTALAFGDLAQAVALRTQQAIHLPAISDCPQCKGRLLATGDKCLRCGNPLWDSLWLTRSD
jgi:hypothetical protein